MNHPTTIREVLLKFSSEQFDANYEGDDDKTEQSFETALQDITRIVEEVIGGQEAFIDIPVVDHLGNVKQIITGESYTPYMLAKNELKKQQADRLRKVLK